MKQILSIILLLIIIFGVIFLLITLDNTLKYKVKLLNNGVVTKEWVTVGSVNNNNNTLSFVDSATNTKIEIQGTFIIEQIK